MGKIEQKKSESATEIIRHMRAEVYRDFRSLLSRNSELGAEISQRPGSEMYSLDLERMKKEIEAVERRVEIGQEK